LVGLAAQQTLGNVIAGSVLATAQPFRVGDRVRLQGGRPGRHRRGNGQLAGAAVHGPRQRRGRDHDSQLARDDVAVVPLREPTAVDIRARLRASAWR
jgi:small conductance mechanosensitive channel